MYFFKCVDKFRQSYSLRNSSFFYSDCAHVNYFLTLTNYALLSINYSTILISQEYLYICCRYGNYVRVEEETRKYQHSISRSTYFLELIVLIFLKINLSVRNNFLLIMNMFS